MKQSEKNILIRTMLQVSKKMPNVTLFRQDVGSAWNGDVTKPSPGVVLIKKARFVRYGLTKGSCDLIGWKTVEITPDMVGKKVAVFVGIEMKTKRGTTTEDQEIFIRNLSEAGGLVGVARSPEDALKILED